MKTLASVQELLQSNHEFDFETFVKERIDSYNNYCEKKGGKITKADQEFRQRVIENLKDLYKYLQEYIVIALDVNPHIAKYNEAIKNCSLEDAKANAQLIINAYNRHNWREFRRLTGILRTKRAWLKGDTPIRKDFFAKLTHASNTMDQACKMVKRKKSLDVKSVYPYWLW